MKKIILISVLLFVPFVGFAKSEFSGSSSLETEYKPKAQYGSNFIGMELAGRGIAYSLNYDRALNSKFSIGAGLTYYQMNILGIGVDLGLVPLYGNYYFTSGQTHRAFLTAGATILYVKAEWPLNSLTPNNELIGSYSQAEGTGVYPNAGIGYEFRSKSGFTVRASAYAQYFYELKPWGGVTAGVNF